MRGSSAVLLALATLGTATNAYLLADWRFALGKRQAAATTILFEFHTTILIEQQQPPPPSYAQPPPPPATEVPANPQASSSQHSHGSDIVQPTDAPVHQPGPSPAPSPSPAPAQQKPTPTRPTASGTGVLVLPTTSGTQQGPASASSDTLDSLDDVQAAAPAASAVDMESRVPQVPETSASNRPLVLGLGIGLPVCVLLVLLAGVLIGLRRRKRNSQHRREAGSELGGIGEWPDMVPDSWSSVGDGSFAEWLHSGASLAPTIPGAIVSDGLPKYHEVSRGGGSGSSSKRQSCAKPPPPS